MQCIYIYVGLTLSHPRNNNIDSKHSAHLMISLRILDVLRNRLLVVRMGFQYLKRIMLDPEQ